MDGTATVIYTLASLTWPTLSKVSFRMIIIMDVFIYLMNNTFSKKGSNNLVKMKIHGEISSDYFSDRSITTIE